MTHAEPTDLSLRLAVACCGETDADVLQELTVLLAETIGHYPSAQRPVLIQAVRGHAARLRPRDTAPWPTTRPQ